MQEYTSGSKKKLHRDFDENSDNEHLLAKRIMVLNGDKSVKRQIANSNERRRMQSINEGFQTLKKLLPQHLDKDKMSKAGILHRSAEHMARLAKEHHALAMENASLRKSLEDNSSGSERKELFLQDNHLRRFKRDTESSDDGISLCSDDHSVSLIDELQKKIALLQEQLNAERKCRLLLEEQLQYCVCHRLNPDTVSSKQVLSEATETTRKTFAAEASVAKRNLETIMAAIEHLEGEERLHHFEKGAEEEQKDDRAVPAVTCNKSTIVWDFCGKCMLNNCDCDLSSYQPACKAHNLGSVDKDSLDLCDHNVQNSTGNNMSKSLWQSPGMFLSQADYNVLSSRTLSSLSYGWHLRSLVSQGTC